MTTLIIENYLQELYLQEFFERFTTNNLKKIKDIFSSNNPDFIERSLRFIPKYNVSHIHNLGKKKIPEFDQQYRFFYKRVSKNEDINKAITSLKVGINSLHKVEENSGFRQLLETFHKILSKSFSDTAVALTISQIVAFFAKILGFSTIYVVGAITAAIAFKIAIILLILIIVVWLIRLSLQGKKE